MKRFVKNLTSLIHSKRYCIHDIFYSLDLNQVWGAASFGLLPPRTTAPPPCPASSSSFPTTMPPTRMPPPSTNANLHSSSSRIGPTSNVYNSRVSCQRSGQWRPNDGEMDKKLESDEATNINPSNFYFVSFSSGDCSKELKTNQRVSTTNPDVSTTILRVSKTNPNNSTTNRKSWQLALLQSVTQGGEESQGFSIQQ